MNKKKKICIIIIIVLVLACIGTIILVNRQPTDGTIAEIIQDGQCIQTIDLSQVEEAYEFTVTGDNNCFNTIRVEPGNISIVAASCPDKICVKTGSISNSLKPITCLPNHLIIRIQNSGTGNLDGISN